MALTFARHREKLAGQFDALYPPGVSRYRHLSLSQEDFWKAKTATGLIRSSRYGGSAAHRWHCLRRAGKTCIGLFAS